MNILENFKKIILFEDEEEIKQKNLQSLENYGLKDTANYIYNHIESGRRYYDIARYYFQKDPLLKQLLIIRENLLKYIYLEKKTNLIEYIIKINYLIKEYFENELYIYVSTKFENLLPYEKKEIEKKYNSIKTSIEIISKHLKQNEVPFSFDTVWKKHYNIPESELEKGEKEFETVRRRSIDGIESL